LRRGGYFVVVVWPVVVVFAVVVVRAVVVAHVVGGSVDRVMVGLVRDRWGVMTRALRDLAHWIA
jgi:hypothetical protein